MKKTRKPGTPVKLSEKAVKSIQNVQHLREEINLLTDEFLLDAKKGKINPKIIANIKSSANELKEWIKKVKKHLDLPPANSK